MSEPAKNGRGLFIAATGQNNGKTTTALAIFQHLVEEAKWAPLSFMKPVGQRTIELQGVLADEDVLLMRDAFELKRDAHFMSPVTVPAGFTRQYLDGKTTNRHIEEAILGGWNALTAEGATVIVEGTGHAGVGSVFDMNNAMVAKLLNLPVVVVAEGGIGRPLDAIALNLALFEKHGADVQGVIFNKVQADKRDQVLEYGAKFLKRFGVEVLGAVEFSEVLRKPSLMRLLLDLKAELLCGENFLDRVPTSIIIGAAALDYVLERIGPKTLIATPASRTDVITAAIHNFTLTRLKRSQVRGEVLGLILTGTQEPHRLCIEQAREVGLPILRTRTDVFETVENIHGSLAKILPSDREKLDLVRAIYRDSLDWSRILNIIRRSR